MNDPRSHLMQLINAFEASRAVHVAAALDLAGALRNGPAKAEALAARTGAHPDALQRLMRSLAALGILKYVADDTFALAPAGEFLRRDIIGTCAPMAELFARTSVWQAWGDLAHSAQTGAIAYDHVHGCSIWDYRIKHPQEGEVFDRAMASGTTRFAQAVLDVCDFARFDHVVDVGGGDGVFLARILERHRHVKGTLFDQPEVIARAQPPQPAGIYEGRYNAISGNFFDSVPQGGDAYLLKWIMHDWSDSAAVDILRTCRRALKPDGRLLVCEYIIGPEFASPEGELMDLTMMVMNGGRERTRDEFAALFAAAGFRLLSITRTSTPLCVIEGEIAPG